MKQTLTIGLGGFLSAEITICRFNEGLELVRTEGGKRKLRGQAAPFYDGTEATQYRVEPRLIERIAPGAFKEAIRSDIFAKVNHADTFARSPDTLSVWEDARGLRYEADVPNTTVGNDLWELVNNKVMRGSSFEAIYDSKDVTWSTEGDAKVYTIQRFVKLRDVSPCFRPAYKATETEAIRRSLVEYELHEATIQRLALWEKIKAEAK